MTSMTTNEVINELRYGDEIDFAEFFVKYWKLATTEDETVMAEDIELTAEDMNNFQIGAFLNHMGTVLGEVIFSEEIESSAWWKENEE